MRLRNHTNIPSEWIRAVVRVACPSGVSGFDVRVSNKAGRGGRGRAYPAGNAYHGRACPFLIVSVPKTDAAARFIWKGGDGYLPHILGSRCETVLFILAHELRHLWQSRVKRGRRVWGARGQFSERDADAYALGMLRRFRRGELDLSSRSAPVAGGEK